MPNTYSPDFLLIPFQLIQDKRLQPLDWAVYWVVYFLSTLKSGKCTASNKTIMELANAGNWRSIANSLARLESCWYVNREIEISNWETKRLSITPTVTFVKGVSLNDDRVSSNDEQNKNNILLYKYNNIWDSKIPQIELPVEDEKKKKKQETIKAVNTLLSKWNSYNPSIGYSNVTQRKSVEAMLEKMSVEEASNLIELAISVQWKEFAPVITTPYELRSKVIKLNNFLERSSKWIQ